MGTTPSSTTPTSPSPTPASSARRWRSGRWLRVVLSHWRRPCGRQRGVRRLRDHRQSRDGRAAARQPRPAGGGGPAHPIPLILPNLLFEDRLSLMVGTLPVELVHVDIHSRDGTVALLLGEHPSGGRHAGRPHHLCGRSPDRLAAHLIGLKRLAALGATRILPCHGAQGRSPRAATDRRSSTRRGSMWKSCSG